MTKWRQRIRKVADTKSSPSTLIQKSIVLKLFHSGKRFQKVPCTWIFLWGYKRISVDGRRIRNNKVAFSNLSGIVWTGSKFSAFDLPFWGVIITRKQNFLSSFQLWHLTSLPTTTLPTEYEANPLTLHFQVLHRFLYYPTKFHFCIFHCVRVIGREFLQPPPSHTHTHPPSPLPSGPVTLEKSRLNRINISHRISKSWEKLQEKQWYRSVIY